MSYNNILVSNLSVVKYIACNPPKTNTRISNFLLLNRQNQILWHEMNFPLGHTANLVTFIIFVRPNMEILMPSSPILIIFLGKEMVLI